MDALGIRPVVIQTLPTQPTSQSAAPVLPQLPQPGGGAEVGQPSFDGAIAEQKRFEAVQQMARDIANIFIVSDRRFTIFKDATGQYITRFTSLRDGRVTYIPEPELVKMSNAGSSAALNIQV